MNLCNTCAYIGDKYSFGKANDMDLMHDETSKALYCCCGDSCHYSEKVNDKHIATCDSYEEI